MNITSVRITKFDNSKTLALATITLDDEFVVSGLKVLDGKNGLWVAMPNRKAQDGEYHDIAFPVTKQAREDIQYAVLTKYNEVEHVQPPNIVDTLKKQGVKNKHATIDVDEDDLPF